MTAPGPVTRSWPVRVSQQIRARSDATSLRQRLVLLLLALLLLACAGVGGTSLLITRHELTVALDQQLEAAGTRYAQALDAGDGSGSEAATATLGQAAGTLAATVRNGQLLSVGVINDGHRTVTVTAADRAVISTMRVSKPHQVRFPDLREYRVRVVAGSSGELLVTGLPVSRNDETLHQLAVFEALIFVVVIVVVGVAGTIAVRRSLRPLDRVAQTALTVAALPLEEREIRVSERVDAQNPETELGRLAGAFNEMLTRVDEALRQRQRSEQRLRSFAADASHELRTPLAVVRAHTELLQRTGSVSAQFDRSLGRISAESERMAQLVDDLLLLAKLDAGRELDRSDVDLSRLALDTVADARVAGAEHVWRLDLPEEPVVVTGDEQRLRQAIVNLLSNARLHTPAGTVVTVAVHASGERGATVTVLDDGPGIAEQLQPTVLDRFVHGEGNRSPGTGSSGLGLSIVAAVAAAHGGEVLVDSRPGRTAITITLPG